MTDYWAQIETFPGGIIRVFEDGAVYGDPYEYCLCFEVQQDNKTVEIKGVYRNSHGQDSRPRPHQWRAIKNAFKAAGMKIVYERMTGARPGEHIVLD